MIYSEKIQRAIKFSVKTHQVYQEQKRKGKGTPYISHPLTAGLILALAGATEDVVVAGILHDTIEDSVSHKKVTPEMVEERFGTTVKDLVVSVTEMDRTLPWAERKALALEHIAHFSHDSVMVKSADMLSNGTELVDDYRVELKAGRDGKEVFSRFKATAEETLTNYERVIEALLARFPESLLTDDLLNLAEEIGWMKQSFPKNDNKSDSGQSSVIGKYLVGDDFDIPFEVKRDPGGLIGGYRIDEEGKTIPATDWIMTRVVPPGKAIRVDDAEFAEAVARYVGRDTPEEPKS